MNHPSFDTARIALEKQLQDAFVDGVSWPIDQASLAALTDMGLSARQIAQYFSVEPWAVEAALQRQLAPRLAKR